jgi:DNA-binding XRE family transcriptional regulator
LPEYLAHDKAKPAMKARIPGAAVSLSAGYEWAMSNMLDEVARRLVAIRAEQGLDQTAMAKWLGVGRTRYVNWEKAENLPSEEYMVLLCDRTDVTLDYIYRGRMDAVPTALAIRLKARELGLDPDAPGFDPEPALAAAARAARRV